MLNILAAYLTSISASGLAPATVAESPTESTRAATEAELSGLASETLNAGWRHSLGVYFMAAGLDGETTVKGVDADVDVDFSDIWDHLEAGAMLAYRAESEKYAITFDSIYMGLGGEKDAGPVKTEVEFDELVLEIAGCLRVDPRTDLFVGARYWSLDAEVDITGPGPGVSTDGKEEWIDPLVGARHTWPFADKWSLTVRGDIGGFGVGSEFSWQALARLNWEISKSTVLAVGYRVVDVDYRDGSGNDEFRYDVLTSGIVAGLIFNL